MEVLGISNFRQIVGIVPSVLGGRSLHILAFRSKTALSYFSWGFLRFSRALIAITWLSFFSKQSYT